MLLVTGRSAGWGQALADYLPVIGVVAENGGVLVGEGDLDPTCSVLPSVDIGKHRESLEECYAELKENYPFLKTTADNAFRLTDWTFELGILTEAELVDIEDICNSRGFAFTYSSIHCHIMSASQDKAKGIIAATKRLPIPETTLDTIITIGDSPNDSDMFNPATFKYSAGVKEIEKYLHCMKYKPRFLSHYNESEGFLSLANCLINSRKKGDSQESSGDQFESFFPSCALHIR